MFWTDAPLPARISYWRVICLKKRRFRAGRLRDIPALTWLEEASCPPRATLEGHCRALIENYRDIVEFSPEKIRLSSPQGEIVLDGSEMCLAQVRPECLMVVGRIDSVSMPEGGAVHG